MPHEFLAAFLRKEGKNDDKNNQHNIRLTLEPLEHFTYNKNVSPTGLDCMLLM